MRMRTRGGGEAAPAASACDDVPERLYVATADVKDYFYSLGNLPAL